MHSTYGNTQNRPKSRRRPYWPERRECVRHNVNSSAFIVLLADGSRLEGSILDISLSGCRICCADPFPADIGARIETGFRLEGLCFRLGGVVQTVHDRHTVGINFLDVSSRKREQLQQLTEEIEALQGQRFFQK